LNLVWEEERIGLILWIVAPGVEKGIWIAHITLEGIGILEYGPVEYLDGVFRMVIMSI
jgi:hypothetical protein